MVVRLLDDVLGFGLLKFFHQIAVRVIDFDFVAARISREDKVALVTLIAKVDDLDCVGTWFQLWEVNHAVGQLCRYRLLFHNLPKLVYHHDVKLIIWLVAAGRNHLVVDVVEGKDKLLLNFVLKVEGP